MRRVGFTGFGLSSLVGREGKAMSVRSAGAHCAPSRAISAILGIHVLPGEGVFLPAEGLLTATSYRPMAPRLSEGHDRFRWRQPPPTGRQPALHG